MYYDLKLVQNYLNTMVFIAEESNTSENVSSEGNVDLLVKACTNRQAFSFLLIQVNVLINTGEYGGGNNGML